jgi:xylulokinase
MSETIIAADIGTSSLKAALVTSSGEVLATARHGYPTHVTPAGWTEQDPRDWLKALSEALRDLAAKHSLSDAGGIVFTGQMSAALLVDGDSTPLYPCIIWSDQRAEREALAAATAAGRAKLYALTGNPAAPTYSAPKLAWVRKHAPDVTGRARHFLQPKDWIVAQLTGRVATDLSDASCTNLIDLRNGCWDPGLFDLYGIDMRLAPEILRSTDLAGPLLPEAAARLGLKPGLPVLMGGGDGPATAAGAGALSDGDGYASLGTSAWVSFTSADPVIDAQCRLATFAHVIPGLYVETGSMQSAGASLEWAAQLIGITAGELAELALTAELPAGTKPFFLPYLQGERTPYWSALSAGTFFGLNRDHRRADIANAVVEGVCLQMRMILDVFRELGRSTDPLTLTGGFGQSALFQQRFADLTGQRVRTLANSEHSTALGAAIAGFLGLGILGSASDAAGWARLGEDIQPAGDRSLTAGRYRIFREAWSHVEALAASVVRLAPDMNEGK